VSAAIWSLDGTRPHPGITLGTYWVTAEGERVQLGAERHHPPNAEPDIVANPVAYPPCNCGGCSETCR
jgi:hypothetical protein